MLKSFDEVLYSQTKLCRVKQGRERGLQGYLNKQYVFPEIIFVICFIKKTLTCCMCVLSFVDSKAQLRYLGNVTVPL